jgi:cysteine desulfurase
MDNAATTVMDDEVVAAMQPFLEERYGNPETPYHLGREAKDGIETARAQVAELLGCKPDEIFFTSGGTESNNWAIKGFEFPTGKDLIVTSAVEHKSVLEPANWMMKKGIASLYVAPVDAQGTIRLDALESYLKDGKVGLVSVQYANNEVGTLQPIEEIDELCKAYGVVFHTDAVQAFGKVGIGIGNTEIDMASLSAHKIHGPMGVGALYVRSGTKLEPLLHGGGHESGMRSGTHGVPQIVGFGKAAELAWSSMRKEMARVSAMAEFMAGELGVKMGAVRNGNPKDRLPNILNVTLPGVDASLVNGILNRYGICVSMGSACRTQGGKSHVLMSMGKNETDCFSTIRISLSRFNSEKEASLLVSYLQVAMTEAKKRTLL